jgi:hypothetical protein
MATPLIVASADRFADFQLTCRSPKVQLNTRSTSDDGRSDRDQDVSFSMSLMSFNASGRAAFSAATQAAYMATATVAAPAGIRKPDARSLTHDMRRIPLQEIVVVPDRRHYAPVARFLAGPMW